jgi:hypothetical protein
MSYSSGCLVSVRSNLRLASKVVCFTAHLVTFFVSQLILAWNESFDSMDELVISGLVSVHNNSSLASNVLFAIYRLTLVLGISSFNVREALVSPLEIRTGNFLLHCTRGSRKPSVLWIPVMASRRHLSPISPLFPYESCPHKAYCHPPDRTTALAEHSSQS